MGIDQNYQTRLLSTLEVANLVPGSASSLIPADFKPTTQLNVSFGNKTVDLGNLFRVSEVKAVPDVGFEPEVRLRGCLSVPLCTSYWIESRLTMGFWTVGWIRWPVSADAHRP